MWGFFVLYGGTSHASSEVGLPRPIGAEELVRRVRAVKLSRRRRTSALSRRVQLGPFELARISVGPGHHQPPLPPLPPRSTGGGRERWSPAGDSPPPDDLGEPGGPGRDGE